MPTTYHRSLDELNKLDIKLKLTISQATSKKEAVADATDASLKEVWKIINKDWFWNEICPIQTKNWLLKKVTPKFILKRIKPSWFEEQNLFLQSPLLKKLKEKYSNFENFKNLTTQERQLLIEAHDFMVSGDKNYHSEVYNNFVRDHKDLANNSSDNPIHRARAHFYFTKDNYAQIEGFRDSLGFFWDYSKDKASNVKDKVKDIFGNYAVHIAAFFAVVLIAVATGLVAMGKANTAMRILKIAFFAVASVGATILFAGVLDLAFDMLVFGAIGLLIGAAVAAAITLGKYIYYHHIKPLFTGKAFEAAPGQDLSKLEDLTKELAVIEKPTQKRFLDLDGKITSRVLDFLKNDYTFKKFEKTQLISRKNKILDRLLQDFSIIQQLAIRASGKKNGDTWEKLPLDLKKFFKTEAGQDYKQSFIDLVHILGRIQSVNPQYKTLYNDILNSYGRTGITIGEPSEEAKKAAYQMEIDFGLVGYAQRIVNATPWAELALCAVVGVAIQLGSYIPGPVGEAIGWLNEEVGHVAEFVIDSIGIHGILAALASAHFVAKWVISKLTLPLVAMGQALHFWLLGRESLEIANDYHKTPSIEKPSHDAFEHVKHELVELGDVPAGIGCEVYKPYAVKAEEQFKERYAKITVSFS